MSSEHAAEDSRGSRLRGWGLRAHSKGDDIESQIWQAQLGGLRLDYACCRLNLLWAQGIERVTACIGSASDISGISTG